MLVYRITHAKYSDSLHTSGNPARWNFKNVKMIYTASTRALACLENVVHTSANALMENYKALVIEIPKTIEIKIIEKSQLKPDWHVYKNSSYTRQIGNEWINMGETAVLKVPSAIVPEESNFLLNPAHEDFKKIKLLRIEPFVFDPRIKG